jgi:hypothetical protein
MTARRILPLAAAAALLVAIPAASQQTRAPETLVWIDVATHHMAGMPDLGPLAGMAARMGGPRGPKSYPQSRNIPAETGRVLDIAMLNTLRPGIEAEQTVPAGLQVGRSLPLMPPGREPPGEQSPGQRTEDMEVTVRQYWGCGATVRPGQPKTVTVTVRRGQVAVQGGLAPSQFVPDRDIEADPRHAVWPNPKNTQRLSDRSSMVGQHRITGDGVPASLQFELDRNADFMPRIALRSQGELSGALDLGWQPVERARAYFLHAVSMQDERNFVVWSSAEVAGAGPELIHYLPGASIERWLAQKVLLPSATTACTIPQGIFAPRGNAQGMAMLSMVAYGPETNIAWPPRPADPRQAWDPEWNVRVRTKSTASAMLGMDLGGMEDAPMDPDGGADAEPPPPEEGKGRRLLRNLLRTL